jgi:hypothetical protein
MEYLAHFCFHEIIVDADDEEDARILAKAEFEKRLNDEKFNNCILVHKNYKED